MATKSGTAEKGKKSHTLVSTVGRHWGQYSMTKQFSLVIFSLVLFFFIVIGGFLWKKISDDRLPYYAEAQLKKNSEIEARLRLFLRNKEGAKLRKISEMTESYQGLFLPRWPLDDEVFVGHDGYPVVIGRNDDLTLWLKPFPKLSTFWNLEDGFAYIITAGGVNLGSSRPELMTSKTGLKRKEIDDFFRSGVATGARIEKDHDLGESVIVHREVQSSNVILFTVSSLSESKTKSMSNVLRYLGWLLCAAVATALIGAYFIRVVIKPLRNMIVYLSGPDSHTDERKQLSTRGDEIGKLDYVVHTIKQKTSQIKNFMAEERQIRSLVHQLLIQESHPTTLESLALLHAEFIVRYPRSQIRNSTSFIYLTHLELNNAQSQQICKLTLTSSGLPFKEINQIFVPRQEVEHLQMTLQRKTTVDKDKMALASDIFVLPLEVAEADIGLFVLRGRNIAAIPAADIKWLKIITKLFAKSLLKQTRQT